MQAHSAGIVAPSLCEHGEPRTGAAEAGQQRRVKIERPPREVIEQSAGNDLQPQKIEKHVGGRHFGACHCPRPGSQRAARGGFQPPEMIDVRIEWPSSLFIRDAGV